MLYRNIGNNQLVPEGGQIIKNLEKSPCYLENPTKAMVCRLRLILDTTEYRQGLLTSTTKPVADILRKKMRHYEGNLV